MPYVLGTGATAEEGKPGRNWLGWIVVGSGGFVALLLALMFGKGPVGIPGGVVADSPPSAASMNPESTFVAPKADDTAPAPAPEATQVVLFARVEPDGASVTALGQTIVSPGRFTFPIATVRWPISVRAELLGYGATELKLPRHVFEDGSQGLTHELMLSLQAIDAAAAGASAPASTPAVTEAARSDRKPSRSGGARAATTTASTTAAATTGEAAMSPAPPPSPDSTADAKPALTPADPATSGGPLERALECLSRGDNACVLTELEGSKGTRELDMLIETYRATGNTSAAEKSMARYLELHPEGRRASQYRRALGVAEPTAP